MLHYSLEEAIEFKQKNEKIVGSVLKPEVTPLLKIIIIQNTPAKFGLLWANQRELFEDEDDSKVISDEEFNRQMEEFENIDLTKREGEFYYVIGVFRYSNGEPRFQPLYTLLNNAE